MSEAKFEVYGPTGALLFSTGNRVLRVLSVSDVAPTATTYTDPEIGAAAVAAGATRKAQPTVGSGTVTYSGDDAGNAKRPVVLY